MGLDWPGLIRAGLFGLKLSPDRFWSLTPVELRIMLGVGVGQPPITRARLEELAAAYADLGKGKTNGGCGEP